jgi:hypothetical protein
LASEDENPELFKDKEIRGNKTITASVEFLYPGKANVEQYFRASDYNGTRSLWISHV